MKILVTGATGFTGEEVFPLLKEKAEIRCLVRPNSNVQMIKKLGHELTYGDFAELSSLKKAMSGCDILANIASFGSGMLHVS